MQTVESSISSKALHCPLHSNKKKKNHFEKAKKLVVNFSHNTEFFSGKFHTKAISVHALFKYSVIALNCIIKFDLITRAGAKRADLRREIQDLISNFLKCKDQSKSWALTPSDTKHDPASCLACRIVCVGSSVTDVI